MSIFNGIEFFAYADDDDTFTLESNTTEQDLLEVLVPTTGRTTINVGSIQLDLVNLTQDALIRIYSRIDGTNYREIFGTLIDWKTTDPDGVMVVNNLITDHDLRITIQSAVAEGAQRTIPYALVVGQ